jgi:hypothetical protein
MYMLVFFSLLFVAAIADVVGPSGVGILGAREGTWLLTLGLFAAMLVTAGYAVCRRWDGIFIDRDNRISLSRFQLITWTVLIVSAIFTAGLTNMTGHDAAPLFIQVPKEIWALLGLGAFTSVAAPAIDEAQKQAKFRSPETAKKAGTNAMAATAGPAAVAQLVKADQGFKGEGRFVGRVFIKESPADARWIDLVTGDNEGAAPVDVSKLQKLVFTLVLLITYGGAIWATMASGPFKAFPLVEIGFVALLGISHATYLADKQLGSS